MKTIRRKNRKNGKRKTMKYYGGCRSGYVRDSINNKFCCDDIAKYYEKKIKETSDITQLDLEIKKLTGDCTSKEFLDERNNKKSISRNKYLQMDDHFKKLSMIKHLKTVEQNNKKSKSIFSRFISSFTPLHL